jgi:hypothetical protein
MEGSWMLYAVDESGRTIRAAPKLDASCPGCGESVVAKCGNVVAWHWSHKADADCDKWSEPETIWHAAWKSRFKDVEVVRERGGDRHRADAVGRGGVVVEFQHSSISPLDIEDREFFYENMVWVLDAADAYKKGRISVDHAVGSDGGEFWKFHWKSRKTSFDCSEKPIFLDLGRVWAPIGPYFFKDKPWRDTDWNRDNLPRSAGWWCRAMRAPTLLRIKKHTSGKGWGVVMTHADFCRQFGGDRHEETPMSRVDFGYLSTEWVSDWRVHGSSLGHAWALEQLDATHGKEAAQ